MFIRLLVVALGITAATIELVGQNSTVAGRTAGDQAGGPRVRILEPAKDGVAMGSVVIRAVIEPASQQVQQVTFFADSREVGHAEKPPFECPWNAGPALREHLVRVEALLPGGRRIAANVKTVGGEANYTENVDRVKVTVSVMENGHFVRGLDAPAFRVFEDGKLQQTSFFHSQQSSLELVVAVDMSESMTNALEAVKQNVNRFLSALRPDDKATVLSFNERHFILAGPDLDRETQKAKVDRLAPWGMTSFYEVILRSFDLLNSQQGRRALVIFTDGEDTSSRIRKEDVEKRADRNDAVLYIIGQGKVLKAPDLIALCRRLADKTGGQAFFPADLDALASAFDTITEELATQYLLTYQPPSSVRDGRYHRIRVEVDGHKDVRARPGYTLTDPGNSK